MSQTPDAQVEIQGKNTENGWVGGDWSERKDEVFSDWSVLSVTSFFGFPFQKNFHKTLFLETTSPLLLLCLLSLSLSSPGAPGLCGVTFFPPFFSFFLLLITFLGRHFPEIPCWCLMEEVKCWWSEEGGMTSLKDQRKK